MEEMEEYSDHAYPHVAVQRSLFERTWDGMSKLEEDYLESDLLLSVGENRVEGEGDWIPVRLQSSQEQPGASGTPKVGAVANQKLKLFQGFGLKNSKKASCLWFLRNTKRL